MKKSFLIILFIALIVTTSLSLVPRDNKVKYPPSPYDGGCFYSGSKEYGFPMSIYTLSYDCVGRLDAPIKQDFFAPFLVNYIFYFVVTSIFYSIFLGINRNLKKTKNNRSSNTKKT